uniref:Proteasome subunit alpha type n=1 Tax=Arcella intermedia TaxID=1963864 RepID=A0A6B2LFT9_9EUKA|eukprot:TRINITY_DN27895_c0_g1_i1.p1 TRINITY_DN27895_c0_g1~~TRINITY_DN27895_c0_g1_i1.p1  ORF type:complete len:254 (+),score=52.59 TRINITY_DN27895_c0_g1_i1:33-794(+)
MASIGTGYDLSATTYSPIGKVFQIDYAQKAVENSGTAIAIRCSDGVVFAVEKIIQSKMLEPGSNKRIQTIDRHIGMVSSGLVPDSRQIANRARKEAASYKDFYDAAIPLRVLNERVSAFVQMYTLYSYLRPFGCTSIIGGIDDSGPQLFMIEPSGISWGYFGCAAGKASQSAKTEIEKLDFSKLTAENAVIEAAKIIYSVHDDLKDRLFDLELSWICPQSKNQHQFVPKELFDKAEAIAKEAQKEEEESEGDD